MKRRLDPSESSEGGATSAWGIVLVPFPYSDRFAEKRRPALIVSSPWLQNEFGLVWVVMITSRANPRWACDVEIHDIGAAGLPAPSVVRPAKLATIEPERIIRSLGTIAAAEREDVAGHLRRMLAS
jgi:mRNA interferase MazF